MGQLVRIVIILFAVWLVIRFAQRALKRFRKVHTASSSRPAGTAPVTEIIPCAHCGVHIPKSRALFSKDKAYCCEEHRRAADKKSGAG